ncbi:flagellar biosynthetic protein FliR [Acetitomaculum ruminis DSM 5522]|uniref:Flagellar biosynthetic protein FliR n=1 Tax=Acetitomaculum ruminis DSM 5522 TaxID=1120918 RepID=A0A1I0ZHI5_9FIRM|nr:flagellar biosynthetic protein FliR [Acetitomaculum ruminis]SFB25229.1 flagellar biosynthetic protein FliR [Acetitomaculum ruminis DSM 5522]
MVNLSFTLGQFEMLLTIFVRITAFIFAAPFFNLRGIPRKVKIALGAAVACMLYTVLPQTTLEYNTVLGYGIIIIKEAIVGVSLGFVADICNQIIMLAGKLIDTDIGLSMVMVFDPVSNNSSSVSGVLYNNFLMMLLIITNMHQYILRALVDSYKVVPINGLNFNYSKLYATVLKFMSDYMMIGFRIVLPIFACMLIINLILGILAKVAPQLNMFAVGIQIKLLVGLIVLYLTITLLPDIAEFIFTQMKEMMVMMLESLYN